VDIFLPVGQAMEITTVLPIRQLVIISQQASAAVSPPGRGRRSARVALTRVEHCTLHYQVRTARRETRAVTVRFAADPEITRVSVEGTLVGPAAAFAAELHQRIHAADRGAICTRAGAGAQAR
jgi:hypothetical protein